MRSSRSTLGLPPKRTYCEIGEMGRDYVRLQVCIFTRGITRWDGDDRSRNRLTIYLVELVLALLVELLDLVGGLGLELVDLGVVEAHGGRGRGGGRGDGLGGGHRRSLGIGHG